MRQRSRMSPRARKHGSRGGFLSLDSLSVASEQRAPEHVKERERRKERDRRVRAPAAYLGPQPPARATGSLNSTARREQSNARPVCAPLRPNRIEPTAHSGPVDVS